MVPGTRLWHPFAAMSDVDGGEFVLVRGEGARVWDVDGTEYLDAIGGLWFAAVGHGRAEIADAVAEQMRSLAAFHTFADLANAPALALAERVAALAPMDDAVVFLTSGGSESVDTAGKIARRYWSLVGEPERRVIVSRRHAYHGMAAYGTSLAGIPANVEGLGTLVDDVLVVPHDDAAAVADALDGLGGRAAAFIGEPVIGAGGVIPPPEGYWTEVERICRERLHLPRPVEPLTWEGAARLLELGHEVGSHTRSHPNLAALGERELDEELAGSREELERRLGAAVLHLSVPYGDAARFTPAVAEAARRAGYASCSTAIRGRNTADADAYALRRDHLVASWPLGDVRYFLARS